MKRIIQNAASIIRSGGTVAFPTETVYGLGADALNEMAVAKIFEIKKRPRFDPLIVHIGSLDQLRQVASFVPLKARMLMDRFWPGPLTVIIKKSDAIPDLVTSGLDAVGVRMPGNQTALDLINAANTPIAAPSANSFGCISPTSAAHVRADLGDSADMIIDGGMCSVGVESTIIAFTDATPALLRPGGTPLEDIEDVIGRVCVPDRNDLSHVSPGRFSRHYAPATPLFLSQTVPNIPAGKRVGLLSLTAPTQPESFEHIEVLSSAGNLSEAAANLFSALKRLDAAELDLIFATEVADTGLGKAINDRLFRASRKRDSRCS